MKREIKFRAWDSEKNRMIFNAECTNFYQQLDPEDPEEFDFGDFILDKKRFTLLQYTGLKDKNGVEIYEGDLLCDPPKDDWEKQNYSCFEVFFHDGDAHADYNIGFTMNRMHNHGSVCGGYIPSFKPKTVSKMEVIGNIFENPELINQVK